ncbi:hypothetical protein [Streptomyces canus]
MDTDQPRRAVADLPQATAVTDAMTTPRIELTLYAYRDRGMTGL